MHDDVARLPFLCPVPVRSLPMVSLHPEHRELAVQTDLAAMSGFGTARYEPRDLLHADFQLASWSNSIARQGSGRAGFYRGYYLKGVGRTPLAANWNDPVDWYHASGHLFPTSAVREYLTTVYMEARGLSHRLVPCRGLLFGRMESAFVGQLESVFGEAFVDLAPIDRALFAITTKPAGFARASNFLWLASRLSGWGEQWLTFVPLMQRHCQPDRSLPGRAEDCSAASLVAHLAAAARRSMEGLAEDFRAGVRWNSLWNNVTLDGRMLDLEVATLACRPFFGSMTAFGFGTPAQSAAQTTARRLHGLELVDHALELQLNVARLRGEVNNLLGLNLRFDPQERSFMSELVEALDRLAADDALFGEQALCDRAMATLADLSPVSSADLRAEITAYVTERRKSWPEPRLSHVRLERTDFEFKRTEPTVSQAFWLSPGTYRRSDWEDAEYMAAHFASIEQCTDVEQALSRIDQAAVAIRARWPVEAP